MIRLETERLRLRPIQSEDVEPLVDLWTDPEVTRFMGGPRDGTQLKTWFEEDVIEPAPDPHDLWPVEEIATGQVIGHCGLLDKEIEGETEIELTYVFAVPAWGKGFATEIAVALRDHAFEKMGITRLIALIDPDNGASQRIAEKVGMRFERDLVRPGGAIRRLYAVTVGEKPDAKP